MLIEPKNNNEQRVLNALLRVDFKSFSVKVFNETAGNSQYLDNWHVDVICQAAEDMRLGKNKRVIINVPPRYMKSIICSVALPAFLLGYTPKSGFCA